MNIFQGDLSSISAKTATLASGLGLLQQSRRNSRQVNWDAVRTACESAFVIKHHIPISCCTRREDWKGLADQSDRPHTLANVESIQLL